MEMNSGAVGLLNMVISVTYRDVTRRYFSALLTFLTGPCVMVHLLDSPGVNSYSFYQYPSLVVQNYRFIIYPSVLPPLQRCIANTSYLSPIVAKSQYESFVQLKN